MDLVIKNGALATAADVFAADIGITDGKIVAIGRDLEGDAVLEVSGHWVFPGFVDPHVHLQMPAGDIVSSDDFLSGTIAAACGGTTTVIDFIEPEEGVSLFEAARARRAEADPKVVIDYSLHLTGNRADPASLDEIRALAAEGYSSLKLYTTYQGLMVGDAEMLRLLRVCREVGMLPIVHAENDAIIDDCQRRLLGAGHTAPRYHPASRPCIAEAEAAGRVLALARVAGVSVYFVHVSCAETMTAIEHAREMGQTVYAEVTPQHLLLEDGEYRREGFEGAKFCCAPPLRLHADRERLWLGLAAGEVQVVATDHCPWKYATHRQRGRDDFTRIPNGLPGIETRIPLLYSEGVEKGRLGMQRFVDTCATAPARLFGLYPQKGSIVVGGDADLVIYDPGREITLGNAMLHQDVDYCPYEGWPIRGYPSIVLSHGRVVARDGEFVGQAGYGRFLSTKS